MSKEQQRETVSHRLTHDERRVAAAQVKSVPPPPPPPSKQVLYDLFLLPARFDEQSGSTPFVPALTSQAGLYKGRGVVPLAQPVSIGAVVVAGVRFLLSEGAWGRGGKCNLSIAARPLDPLSKEKALVSWEEWLINQAASNSPFSWTTQSFDAR